jgi:hypothetical protein
MLKAGSQSASVRMEASCPPNPFIHLRLCSQPQRSSSSPAPSKPC